MKNSKEKSVTSKEKNKNRYLPKISLTLLIIISIQSYLIAQVKTGDFTITYSESGSGLNRSFYMSVPTDYDSTLSYPLLFAWHGGGMPGSSIRSMMKYVNGQINAIICCPDINSMPNTKVSEMVSQSLNYVKNYSIDESKRVVSGFSMGGSYAFKLGLQNPSYFKGIIGLSPAISIQQFNNGMWDNISQINMATILGDLDFNFSSVDQLMNEIQNQGGYLIYKIKPDVTHSDNVYYNSQEFKDDYYECWEKIFGLSKIQDNVIDITRVYPNPFSDVINISIDEDLQDLLELKVFDIIGNEVYSNIVDKISNDLTIKTLNLSKGIYILQLKYFHQILSDR